MKRIDLNDLESRIKKLTKPTPQQVVNLIIEMQGELQ